MVRWRVPGNWPGHPLQPRRQRILVCLSRSTDVRDGACSRTLGPDTTARLRADMIESVAADCTPDLLLPDKKPFGVEDELAGALETLPCGGHRRRLVLLLRDILDNPAITRQVWRKNGCFETIGICDHQVLVAGSPEVLDLRRASAVPPFAAAKLQFCGCVARQPGRQTAAAVRRQLGLQRSAPP